MPCDIAEAGCAEVSPSWRKGAMSGREGWGSLSQAQGMKGTCFRWDMGRGRSGALEAGRDWGKQLLPPSRERACFMLVNLCCISSQALFSWSGCCAVCSVFLTERSGVGSGQLCRQNGLNHTSDRAVGGLWASREEGCRWVGALEKSPVWGKSPRPREVAARKRAGELDVLRLLCSV